MLLLTTLLSFHLIITYYFSLVGQLNNDIKQVFQYITSAQLMKRHLIVTNL
jgi:hypothetical protein